MPVEGWIISMVGSLLLLALGVVLMLADVKLGSGVVSLLGTGCTLIAVIILLPMESPPEKWRLVATIRNIVIVTGVVLSAFFLFMTYKAYETKKLKRKLDMESIIGKKGVAKTDVAPKGLVNVEGELWSARVKGKPYVMKGEDVEVIGYEGLTLVVKPFNLGEAERLTKEKGITRWTPTED
ncbi:MAG: NfeD family protein [Candidatus Freyarchaeota archaeon]|nr:NfeD family protein [Candidatus Freyrarchaeum guaymaensis]HDO80697.1 hypothetical protein [Candidatus Bathyarchaeota archaeon]